MKDGEFTCFDDILAKIKQLSEAEKCMITEIITLCKLLLVNPATSAAGERSFSSSRRLKTWLRTRSRLIFVFALSQFSGSDYLGGWNRLF